MKLKALDFIKRFEHFWGYVENAEQDYRINGHRGRLPPDFCNDPWDEQFAKAYDEISTDLHRFKKRKFYAVPVGLAFFLRGRNSGGSWQQH